VIVCEEAGLPSTRWRPPDSDCKKLCMGETSVNEVESVRRGEDTDSGYSLYSSEIWTRPLGSSRSSATVRTGRSWRQNRCMMNQSPTSYRMLCGKVTGWRIQLRTFAIASLKPCDDKDQNERSRGEAPTCLVVRQLYTEFEPTPPFLGQGHLPELWKLRGKMSTRACVCKLSNVRIRA
jgi:hypothetical protein